MQTHGPSKIVLPIFAGQGATRTSLLHAADQALRDANSPAGSLLLSSCLEAFLAELASLSLEELDQSNIRSADFDHPHRLLTPHPRYARNHIVSAIFLFLAQVLRYQSYAQSTSRSLLHLLKTNTDYAVGILGLSSGIFPACVVAASHSLISYITTSVEIFRSVFWISLRVLQSTRKLFSEKPVDPTLPWGTTYLGLTKSAVEQHISRFEEKYCRSSSLRVAAVLDEKNVTISGRPDLLFKFSTFVSPHCTVHPTTIDALYHSELHFPHTCNQILEDFSRRNIRFPDYRDLHCSLRSTISGDIVHPSSNHPTLVELVIDMVLIRPVHWDLVVKKAAAAIPPEVTLCSINIGPGSSGIRALEKAATERVLECVDATSDTHGETLPAKQEPIAIIGMAARTPGATNTNQLWEVLENGVDTVSKIPIDRFDGLLHTPANSDPSVCETRVETGNFIDNLADFDHKFFKISPREARSMDPQQRILLHTAYEALEGAGYVPDATPCFRRAKFACYIGAATQDYAENLANDIDIHYTTGTLRAFLSGRISYAMQWGGPSVVVDTACSSSIVAIHQACRALMNKDCDAALAGGVNIMTSANMFIGLERGHFLSPSGQCKSFDVSADGYSRGEGCCLFVFKRLRDAIAENDNILGVIRGVEINQSGLAPSITHPHSPTQADLLKMLLKHSGICPMRVSIVEAHGTGTEAGDSCELASIRSVLSLGRTPDNPLHVTSIKGNIGHLEAASGAVGLCKLLLMLRHNVIPAQISLKTLHPLIVPLNTDNTLIKTSPTPWAAESTPRVAVLNNFGAAGSNGALVLEEYIKPQQLAVPSSASYVFGISATSAGALENHRSRHLQWLGDPRNHDAPLCDIAYTATARRQIYPFRLAVTATDKDQLMRALGTASVTHVERHAGRAIFVFPGQGNRHPDMGASLYATSVVFRDCIDRCHRFLLSLGYPGILPSVSRKTCNYVLEASEEFEARQCTILAVEFGLTSLWKHWGVVPAGVIGQSLGEYAAMVAAEVLTIETALSIVARRARLMSRACVMGKTGMVSVTLPFAQVQGILSTRALFPNVTVACVNTKSSCVVSGPVQELHTFVAYSTSTYGCKSVVLDVPLGFHSSAIDPILDDLRDHIATLPVHAPVIPIASNVYGTVVPVGDGSAFQADYLVKHCRQPVLFAQGLQELERYLDPSQIDAWIDVGPHAMCLPMVKTTLSLPSETLCLPSMIEHTPAWDTLTNTLSQLYRTAVPVDWRRVFSERGAYSCIDLPTYPFDSQKFWVPYGSHAVQASAEPRLRRHPPGHHMLLSWSQCPSRQNGNAAIFETPIAQLAAYIEGHKVGGFALCPASVYLEQTIAGAIITQHYMGLDFGRSMPVLRNVEFSRPLVLHQDVPLIVRTHVTVHEDGSGSFRISSRLESSHEEHVHVQGDLRFSSIREISSNLALELPGNPMLMEDLARQEAAPEVFSTHTAYEVIFPRIVEYAEDYRTIESLIVRGDGTSGVAHVSLSSSLDVQPLFLDTLLHVAGFMINMQGGISDAYICSGISWLKVLRELVDDRQPYSVHCINKRISSLYFISADILAIQESNPPVVVAQLRGAQFRRVRLTSLQRGLAMAADPKGSRSRARTNSNSIITPSSPRSVIFARSRSNTHSNTMCSDALALDVYEAGGFFTGCGDPPSPRTLVSESRGTCEQHGPDVDDGERIRNIMSEVLGMESGEMEDDADLGALGLDSLGSIEALQALRVALNRPIPHDIFSRFPTLSALYDFLAADPKDGQNIKSSSSKGGWGSADTDKPVPDVILSPLQQCSGVQHTPLYLVHDGSGLINHYERLSSLHRNVWGISNPRFFGGEAWESLDEMAETYAQTVERHANAAPLMLGGWSFGGLVAFEIARVLTSRGVLVKGIVLIDSPFPSTPPLLSDAIVEHLREKEHNIVAPEPSMRALVLRQFKQSSALLDRHARSARDAAEAVVPVSLAFLRCTAGFRPNDVCIPAWFRQRDDADVGSIIGSWQALSRTPIAIWDVPGHHFEPFSDMHVKETSVQLDRACRHLDSL